MTRHWPKWVLAVALLLSVVSGWAVTRLRPEGGLDGMLDPHDPATAAMGRVLADFPLAEELLVLASLPPGDDDTAKLTAFADRFAAALTAAAPDLVQAVRWKPGPHARAFVEKVMAPAGLLYLDAARLAAAKQRLTPAAMREQLARDAAMLAAPGPAAGGLAKVIVQDPLRLHEFLLASLQTAGLPSMGGDAFFSTSGRDVLIRVEGRRPPGDLAFAARLTAAVTAASDSLSRYSGGGLGRGSADVRTRQTPSLTLPREHTGEGTGGSPPVNGLEIRISGAYAIAAHNAALIRRDAIESTVFSVVSLALLFAALYRRPVRTFLIAFTPVAIGILWGFGAYALLRSTITPLAAVVGGALGGVGIDYPVHLTAHRRPGETPAGTARRMFMPLLAAWATSVIGFAVVAWSPLRLLRDFALIGSLGLTGAWLATLTILPAVLTLAGDGGDGVAATRGAFATRLWPLIADRPRRLVTIGGTLAAVLIVAAVCVLPSLRQDTHLTALHPRPNAPLDDLDEINRRMGFGGASFLLHLTAADDATLLRRAWQARRALEACDLVGGVFGPASLLPDPDAAAGRVAGPPVVDAEATVAAFRAAVVASDFEASAFGKYEDFLRTLLRPTRSPALGDLRAYPELAQTMLPAGNATVEAMAVVSLTREPKTPEHVNAAVAAVRRRVAGIEGVTLTGMAVLADDARAAVRRDTPRVAVTALVAITAFLLIHLRSVTLAFLTVLPTLVSFAAVVLAMAAFGIGLNLVNLVMFPLLLGINVDYGIFATDVLRPAVKDRAGERFLAASTALLACAAATVLGFGSLVTVSVPAVAGLGRLINVGLVACVIGALAVLWPAVLLIARRRGRA